MQVPEVQYVSRRTGRAELDEHAEPPANSEIEVDLKPSERSREAILADIRQKMDQLKGVTVNIGQPISHRLDHLLSGVRAQVAIKLFGNDLNELRTNADRIRQVIGAVPGIVDVQIEKQVMVPQLVVKLKRDALQRYGIQAGRVAENLEVFYNGKVTGQVLDGPKTFDILLRVENNERIDIERIKRAEISDSQGNAIPLEQVADIAYTTAINSISHENTLRRIVISCNVQGRDLGSTVKELQTRVAQEVKLPTGYFVQYGGQFESQQEATRLIGLLSILLHSRHIPGTLQPLQVVAYRFANHAQRTPGPHWQRGGGDADGRYVFGGHAGGFHHPDGHCFAQRHHDDFRTTSTSLSRKAKHFRNT